MNTIVLKTLEKDTLYNENDTFIRGCGRLTTRFRQQPFRPCIGQL